jgi:hypothetical protein
MLMLTIQTPYNMPLVNRQAKSLEHATLLLLQLLRIRLALCPQSPETLLGFRLHLRLRQTVAEEAAMARCRSVSTGC